MRSDNLQLACVQPPTSLQKRWSSWSRWSRATSTYGQTKLSFKLDFPSSLCRAAFVILAMFDPFLSIQINACNICICWFIKGANKEVAWDKIYFQRALVEVTQEFKLKLCFLFEIKKSSNSFQCQEHERNRFILKNVIVWLHSR